MFRSFFNKVNWKSVSVDAEMKAKINAIDRSQAVIEFNSEGIIQTANENFLKTVGYSLSEIQGQHHRLFVDPTYAKSQEYKDFWAKLKRGEYETAEYMRFGKDGKEVWIQASYNPIFDQSGKVSGVVKFATDITETKIHNTENDGMIRALNKAQAVIHFNTDGTIQWANENFLNAVGYRLDEIQGEHHRMFVEHKFAESDEYSEFWESLNRGEYQAAEYMRYGKDAKEIWIQASYNPIVDENGRVIKIVKFATDVTDRRMRNADFEGQIAAVNKAQAVIHFNLDGTIIDANDNFLATLGYELEEIKGQHHSMFVETNYGASAEYKEFWAKLNRGEFQSAEYRRVGKGGKTVWIQATYNPIFDLNGNPFKVVKFATDITEVMNERSNKDELQSRITRELENITTAMSNASDKAAEAAGASEETNASVQAVAAGVEEFDASISSIAESMSKSRETSDQAFERTASGAEASKRLLETASDMTNVVELIQDIASQINLLALNATIESARAGEAGRGFAVVANEVKNLAGQAASATDQISREIQGIQEVSSEVDDNFNAIQASLENVKNYVTDSASAVEQQSAAAREMTENMQAAAKSVSTINNNINEIASATDKASTATNKVEEMSREAS